MKGANKEIHKGDIKQLLNQPLKKKGKIAKRALATSR